MDYRTKSKSNTGSGNTSKKRETYETRTLTYKDATGKSQSITKEKKLSGSKETVGQTYTVYYDKNKPTKAIVEGENESGGMRVFGIIFLLVGGSVLSYTVLSIVRGARNRVINP